jgi:hypothetical protein
MALIPAPPIFTPDPFVHKIVEIEIFKMLELAAGRRKQLLAYIYMRIHRAAHVKKQQHLHLVVPFRYHLDIQKTGISGRSPNRAGQIQFKRFSLSCKGAQLAQGHLHVACSQLD